MRLGVLAIAVALLMGAAMPLLAVGPAQLVVGSQHDLTPTGSGPISSALTDSCYFCHAPHNVTNTMGALWDHTLSTQTYTTYASTTYNSGAQTPSAGSSKLCLSCHDGTVAVGQTISAGLISTSGALAAADNLGTNLAKSHPVSMVPADDGQLVSTLFATPASTKDSSVQLVGGKVECVTCHDPHVQNKDTNQGMFLARSNSGGTLCLACHDPSRIQPNQLNGWTTGSHATATNAVPTTGSFAPYGTVAGDACGSCHGAHNNNSIPRNLKAAEEAACSACHSGTNATPALLNVMGEFAKTYSHPTTTVSGAHDAKETLPINTTRHAECVDCHNSHAAAAQTGTALAPTIQAPMNGVSGYDTSGSQMPAAKEYQVCLKCHGDSTNKPATSVYGRTASRYPVGPIGTYPAPPPMPADQYNIRLKFMSPISHNVMGYSVPSVTSAHLRPYMLNVDGTNNTSRPLTMTTVLYCTDCHTNDQARASKGTGPNGTHGSSYSHLLQMNLYQEPTGGASGGANVASNYTMCNKCHIVEGTGSIYQNGLHTNHMDKGSACGSCHDPHGVIGGNAVTNRALINMDRTVIRPAGANQGFYTTTAGHGGCYLICHGESHTPHTY
jgi:predicted CXXCH cytochrome family protein